MKQFYEVYAAPEFILPLVTLLETYFSGKLEKVSALPTQLRITELQQKFINTVLVKVICSSHLEIRHR